MTERAERALALSLLVLVPVQRLALALGQPDLLHDLDAAELKHMDLSLLGLPGGATGIDRLRAFLSSPEDIHHGGYPVLSLLYLGASRVLGHSLFLLRLAPIAAASLAALCLALLLHRRAGIRATWVALALFVGAPPLLLKWTTTARGGHVEGIVFPILLALLLDRALRGGRGRWLLAGAVAGFSVYFTYLAAPSVLVLGLGALLERGASDRRAALGAAGALLLGGIVGFLPWILGLLVLHLPYLDASIHQTSNPQEAAQVHARTLLATLGGLRAGLAHNLWPWGVHTSPEAAYASATPDILVFKPTVGLWLQRGVVSAAALLGLGWAARRRSALLVALTLLPGIQHLFVLRAANTVGYPLVPHRYLVVAFPALCAAAGLGAAWPRWGRPVAAAVLGVAVLGVISQLAWWAPPRWEQFGGWDAAAFRQAGVGQVRIDEGEEVLPLLRAKGERADELRRGVALVYPEMADYYLLFRADPNHRPYPPHLFSEPDPLSQDEAQRRAVVQGALEATQVRAGGDRAKLRRWLCSWDPAPEQEAAVREAWAQAGVSCGE